MKSVFLHIPKTGGTSINNMLRPELNDHYTWEDWFVTGKNTTRTVLDHSEYFVYSFVRNPWDRIVSLYHYKKNTHQEGFQKNKTDLLGFNDWIQAVYVDKDKDYIGAHELKTYLDFLSYGGDIKVDFIGKLENIEKDVVELCDILGKPIPPIKCKNVRECKTKTYQEEYTPETVNIIGDYFTQDIKTFNYEF